MRCGATSMRAACPAGSLRTFSQSDEPRAHVAWGEGDEFGGASKGILIHASAGGQVVAPFDGRIEFAGPFRGYGQILIIEHGDGYHSLLAGLERIDGVVGHAVRVAVDEALELTLHDPRFWWIALVVR